MISLKIPEQGTANLPTTPKLELGIPLDVIHSLVWLSDTKILVLVRENSSLRVESLSSDRAGLKEIVDMIRAHRPDLPILHYGESAAS
jgi:hypothetical protein